MKHNIYVYILIAGLTSYLIRVLPLTLIRKPIRNVFLKSFLYYVPYVTLAVMTFPAIVEATQSPLSGFLALAAGAILSWHNKSLPLVAAVCCLTVFICESFL
ncbi:MAG: AzlD domain-containing protein [Erysipelotrichaceae bacterium]|nr:AzlD domain-containing protein [Erysipelotrichaceae bacterium]